MTRNNDFRNRQNIRSKSTRCKYESGKNLNPLKCPIDGNEVQTYFNDMATNQEILDLQVKCSGECNWQNTLKEFLDIRKFECPQFKNKFIVNEYVFDKFMKKIISNEDMLRNIQNELAVCQEKIEKFGKAQKDIKNLMVIGAKYADFKVKDVFDKTKNYTDGLFVNNDNLKETLKNLELSIQLADNKRVTGEFILKINDYQQRFANAKLCNEAFHSAPFYTDSYGYKVCLRVYLNGDGMGRGSCISIFVVIMKGEYDGLLEWLFVIRLIYFKNIGRDRIDSWLLRPKQDSSKKPIKNMNVGIGSPTFLEHSELDEGFIFNNKLYIHVVVRRLGQGKYLQRPREWLMFDKVINLEEKLIIKTKLFQKII